MPLVLYLLTALALLWIVRRWVMPVSRTAALALLLFPFCFTGRALLTGGVDKFMLSAAKHLARLLVDRGASNDPSLRSG